MEERNTSVKEQDRLDIRKYSFAQSTLNEWNRLSTDCVNWTLDKPMASFSICYLFFFALGVKRILVDDQLNINTSLCNYLVYFYFDW